MGRTRHIWTLEEFAFVRENYLTLTDKQIIEKLGLMVSMNAVSAFRVRNGMILPYDLAKARQQQALEENRPPVRWTQRQYEIIRDNYLTMTDTELLKVTGLKCGRSTIADYRKKHGFILPENTAKERSLTSLRAYHLKKKQGKGLPEELKGCNIDVICYYGALNNQKKQRIRTKWVDKANIKLDNLLEDVCNALEQSKEDILGDHQGRHLTIARQIFCYVANFLFKEKSYSEIAGYLGYTSHSMAYVNAEKVKQWLSIRDASFMSVWYQYKKNSKLFK